MDATGEATTGVSFKLGHRPALDGLRGIFVLLVMSLHAGLPFAHGAGLGVDGFFVLSGFLITSLLVQEWKRTGSISLRAFYTRRALRLLPALFVLLLVCSAITLVHYTGDPAVASWRGIGLSLLYINNWVTLFFGENNVGLGLMGHGWSLSIEEQFYLAWPLVLIGLLALRPRAKWLVAATAALAVGSAAWRLFLLTNGVGTVRLFLGSDTRADALLTGCTLGLLLSFDLVQSSPRLLRFTRPLVVLSVILLGYLCAAPGWPESDFLFAGGFTIVAAAVGVIILHLMISPNGRMARILSQPALVKIGVVSYGLYLWHYPVFNLITPGPQGWMNWQVQLVRLTVTIAVTLLSYRLVERPMLRLKDRLHERSAVTSPELHAVPVRVTPSVNR